MSGGATALIGPPVGSVQQLLDRMAAIEQALPPTDGIASFNRLYRLVTEAIQEQLSLSSFGDPAWLGHLDVVFGNLYLDAVRTGVEDPDHAPRAWAPLLERRSDPSITPLQFALAGMNAHINHDLPLAVVSASSDLDTTPDTGSHHTDYETVNSILAQVEPAARKSFTAQLLLTLDEEAPGVQDVVANFDIVTAREAAWTNANTLWVLRLASPALEADYLKSLDRLVGFAGRGLLVPLLS